MMPYCRFCVLSIYLLLLACNDRQTDGNTGGTKSADTVTGTQVDVTPTAAVCYSSVKKQDLIELQLVFLNDSVNGTMNYQISGKDKNMGTLRGTVRGDSIFAEYTFSSEGTESVRQVAFLQKQDSLLEGYGDVEEKGRSNVFKNPSALNYGKGVVLIKVDCKK